MIKVAVRLRIKPPKRRNPGERLRARLYYRKNRSKLRVQRRRYLRSHKSVLKHRKQFMRFKPTWFKKPKKPKVHKPKATHFKLHIPHIKKPKPFHMPKTPGLKFKPKIHRHIQKKH